MNESRKDYFGSRVTLTSLPVFKPPIGPEAPNLRRLDLPQGELAQFHDSDEPMRYMAMIELVAGTVRGNHFHKVKVESIYMMRGEMDLLVADARNPSELLRIGMRAGDLVTIQTGIIHALQIRLDGSAIEYAPTRFDPSDTHRFQIC